MMMTIHILMFVIWMSQVPKIRWQSVCNSSRVVTDLHLTTIMMSSADGNEIDIGAIIAKLIMPVAEGTHSAMSMLNAVADANRN